MSQELSISDCELFLGYLGNLSFKYIPTTGNRQQLKYCLSPQKMSQDLDTPEGEATITTEKEDDTGVGSRQKDITSGTRLHVTTEAVSTAEKEVVNESESNAETLCISGNVLTPGKGHEVDSDSTAETVVLAGNKDVSDTTENEALPDYYFDLYLCQRGHLNVMTAEI